MNSQNKKTWKKEQSPFLICGFICAFVVLYFNPNIVDPFNSAKLWLLILGTSVLFSYLATILLRVKFKVSRGISSKYLWLLLAFILFETIALTQTKSFYTGLFGEYMRKNGYLTYLCLTIFAAVSYLSFKLNNFKTIFYIFLFTACLEASYGLLQHFGKDFINWNNQYNPIIGTLGNPNFSSATFAVLVVYIFTFTFKSNYSRIIKLALYLFSGFVGLLIYWTQAKQGLLSLCFGLAVYLIIYLFSTRNRLFIPILFFSILISIGAILGMFQRGPFTDLLYKDSVSLRGYYWRAGIEMFRHNILFGVGLDSYGDYFKEYREQEYAYTRGFDITSTNSHNTFIQHFATGGIFVGAVYLLIVSLVFLSLIKTVKLARSMDIQKLDISYFHLIALFSALIAFYSQSLVSIDNIGIGILGWFLTPCFLAAAEKYKRQFIGIDKDNGVRIFSNSTTLIFVQRFIALIVLIPSIFIVSLLYKAETEFVKVNGIKTDSSTNVNQLKELLNVAVNKSLLEPSLKVAIAFKYANVNLLNDSKQILIDVLNKNPRNPDALRLQAQINESESNFGEAIKTREIIKSFDPWNLNNIYNLGIDYSRNGDVNNAIANFEFVANSGTDFPEVKSSIDNLEKLKVNK